jgi:ATP-dependent protease ClpP protease subunit
MIWSKKIRRSRVISDSDGEDSPATISISASPQTIPQANRVYFYSHIDNESVLELNKQIDEATRQMQIVQLTLDLTAPPPIRLYINSMGGEVAASLCAADKIRRSVVPIHTYCEGEIASGATLISVSGHRRFMTQHSFFLIHQISSDFWGKYVEFEDEMENLKMMMKIIKEIYTQKTKIPESTLDDLLKHDLYIPPGDCLKWGLVDEII